MNQFFPVCVAFLATLFLSASALPPRAEGAEPQGAKNVAPNNTIIIPFDGYGALKGKQENAAIAEHAPMLSLWSDTRLGVPEPILYVALWRDGTIIWVASGDKKLDYWSRNGTGHFLSKISEKQVEDFLSAFEKVDFLEFSGKMTPLKAQGIPHFFHLDAENEQFRLGMNNILWADQHEGPPWSQEVRQIADKWRAVLELLLELIPEKGEQISLSIKSDTDKRQWEITPIPLRQEDRQQDNGNVRNNGNWGQVPLRPR